jgi:hypothetical protein
MINKLVNSLIFLFLVLLVISGCSSPQKALTVFAPIQIESVEADNLRAETIAQVHAESGTVAIVDEHGEFSIPIPTATKTTADGLRSSETFTLDLNASLDTTIGPIKRLLIEYQFPPGRFNVLTEFYPDTVSIPIPVITETVKADEDFLQMFKQYLIGGILGFLFAIILCLRSK